MPSRRDTPKTVYCYPHFNLHLKPLHDGRYLSCFKCGLMKYRERFCIQMWSDGMFYKLATFEDTTARYPLS